MTTDVRLVHLWKADAPIVCTLFPMVTDARLAHSLKSPFPRLVTPFGITIVVMAV